MAEANFLALSNFFESLLFAVSTLTPRSYTPLIPPSRVLIVKPTTLTSTLEVLAIDEGEGAPRRVRIPDLVRAGVCCRWWFRGERRWVGLLFIIIIIIWVVTLKGNSEIHPDLRLSKSKPAELAQKDVEDRLYKRRLVVIVVLPVAMVIFVLGFVMRYLRRRMPKSILGIIFFSHLNSFLNCNAPNLEVFSFVDIVAATNNFSIENKVGEGGYGPVYKGELPNEQEIAVKRLSKMSKQGLEEFKNEVKLTAKLQHVNLVRLLGFCTQREEKMLIYEYMPNKSLDFYLFDLDKRLLLDWKKRVQIIEGVTQGLLYLQEYSRLTILHRDLKASNILLDNEMRPKISDLGMARIFDEREPNSKRIVGTYGYVPPECVKEGAYSMKSDVYSFGVLLLQIISGKKNTLYGSNKNMTLLEYGYELWKDGKGMELMDPSLDDASSSCKLMTCMQVALLCVQERPADRPFMLEVYSMLKNETSAFAMPKRPAFSLNRDEDEEKNPTLRLADCSNDATISQMLPR
ncbi:hypothetical protein L1049_027337 [Liquidambar formosana]|uniref:Protein kinase domain-containing protein n=1 Tax=Liquidambar formosana TaxID=63359 RepID=A0AAP0N8M2_LIQFO